MAGLLIKPGAEAHRQHTTDQPVVAHLLAASKANADQLLDTLGASREGLTEAEVRQRRRQFGRNRVAHETAPTWLRLLASNFTNPFILVLLIIGVVSYVSGDRPAVVVVALMVAVSVLMRFLQEYRSSKAAEKLRLWCAQRPRSSDAAGKGVARRCRKRRRRRLKTLCRATSSTCRPAT